MIRRKAWSWKLKIKVSLLPIVYTREVFFQEKSKVRANFLILLLCTMREHTVGGNYAEISLRKKIYLAGRIRIEGAFFDQTDASHRRPKRPKHINLMWSISYRQMSSYWPVKRSMQLQFVYFLACFSGIWILIPLFDIFIHPLTIPWLRHLAKLFYTPLKGNNLVPSPLLVTYP